MRTIKLFCVIGTVIIGMAAFSIMGTAYAQTEDATKAAESGQEVTTVTSDARSGREPAICYAIAITIGLACLSSAYAVAKVGSSALGAAAEKPELLGKALIFVGLAEGIAIYGLIIAIMLVMKL